MLGSFQKFKYAAAAVLLSSALSLIVYHLAIGAAVPAGAAEKILPGGSQVSEIAGYKSWTKVNAVPQLMPERVAMSCVYWGAPGGIEIDGQANPHRDKYFTVYVNEVGRAAMLKQKRPKFPVGSVIVKEKLPARDSQTPELLTVMIKQRKGFNPANGDWEYMVVDGTGTKMEGRGNLENCQGCHLGNEESDYVFRTYLSGETAKSLK